MNAHPSYNATILSRWRLIKNGGDDFINEFLVQKAAETTAQFTARRNITYDPATASSAVDDVINSLSARLDVRRSGGLPEYQEVVAGGLGGVDKNGSSMQDFLISEAIPELCYMGKFCWVFNNFSDPSDERRLPWIEFYPAESIFNWEYTNGLLSMIALKYKSLDPEGDEVDVVRVYKRTSPTVVETWLQTEADVELDVTTLAEGSSKQTLQLSSFPAHIAELPVGLLSKIDKMQIAMLNIESADIDWLRTANMTVYVEQSHSSGMSSIVKADDNTVEEDRREVLLGSNVGRSYGIGLNPPQFIAAPTDSIQASMKKQDQISGRIREILKTTLSQMKLASAESLGLLGQGMEAGLFIIGAILKSAEDSFALSFHDYLKRSFDPVTVSYPKKYELRTISERIAESKNIKEISKTFGSNLAKKYMEIEAIKTILEGKITHSELQEISKEVLESDFCIYDPNTVSSLVNEGIISRQLASKSLGAPDNDYTDAEKEHIRRIVAVQISQTSGTGELNPDPSFTEEVRKEAALEVRDSGVS